MLNEPVAQALLQGLHSDFVGLRLLEFAVPPPDTAQHRRVRGLSEKIVAAGKARAFESLRSGVSVCVVEQ